MSITPPPAFCLFCTLACVTLGLKLNSVSITVTSNLAVITSHQFYGLRDIYCYEFYEQASKHINTTLLSLLRPHENDLFDPITPVICTVISDLHLHFALTYWEWLPAFKVTFEYDFRRLLSNYVVWQMIRDKVSLLSSPFRKARAKFNERISGVKDSDPRWRTCTGITNDNMGVPIGSLYINSFFDQSAIVKVLIKCFVHVQVNTLKVDVLQVIPDQRNDVYKQA